MIVKRAKFILSIIAGLLVALAAGNLRAALTIHPVGLVAAQDVDGDDVFERTGEGAAGYVYEILRSLKSRSRQLSAVPGAGAIPTSVNGAGSVASGFAVVNKLMAIPPAALQTSLPSVGKTILPTGPPFRFFRPPREDMLSIVSYYS
jgi:hypothetical protein